MFKLIQQRKMAVFIIALLSACGIVVASSALMGQSNKLCSDAGMNSIDMEMASLDTIAQSESNPVDWQKERSLRKKIDVINEEYKQLASQAQSQIDSQGKVEDSLRTRGLDCAKRFQDANEVYAQFWLANNGKTRAKLARETGAARVKNADMLFNEIDSDKIDAYNEQMKVLSQARSEYMEEAKTDVSEKDREAIKASLLPRVNKLVSSFQNLLSQIQSLISQAKSELGSVGGLTACASSAISSSEGSSASLISPLTGLLGMVQNLMSDASSLMSDLQSL